MIAALLASSSEASLTMPADAHFPSGSVTVLDRDRRYVVAQGQILPRLGLAPDRLVGQRLHDIFPSDVVASSEEVYARAFAGESVTLVLPWNNRLLEIHVTPAEHDESGVSAVLAIAEDVTAERRAASRLRVQSEASAILGESLEIDTTLAAIADLIVTHLADFCIVHVLDDNGRLQRVAYGHADPSQVDLALELLKGYELRPEFAHGPARVVETGQTEVLDEISDDILAASAVDEQQFELLRRMNMTASLIVPMRARGRVVGALSLVATGSHPPYDQEDRSLAEDLAQRMALAVENARAFRLIRQERDEMRETVAAERLTMVALSRLAASDAIGIATIEGESIVEANSAFLRIVGYESRDLLAGELNWWNMTPPEYRAMDVHGFAELLATGVSTPFEKECLRQDGSRAPVLVGAALLDREKLRRACFVVDLSARHELEQAQLAFMKSLGTDLTAPITLTRWASQVMGRQEWAGQPVFENPDLKAGSHWTAHGPQEDAIQGTTGPIMASAWSGSGAGVTRERVRRLGRGKRRRVPGVDVN